MKRTRAVLLDRSGAGAPGEAESEESPADPQPGRSRQTIASTSAACSREHGQAADVRLGGGGPVAVARVTDPIHTARFT